MEQSLQLSKKDTIFVLLQRTDYQHEVAIKLKRLRLESIYHGFFLPYFEPLRRKKIARAFGQDMELEFERIKGHLPAQAKKILDVGCGIGGIDVFLSRHYQHKVEFYLMDKTGISKIYYGFEKKAAFYNSLERTKEFLLMNKLPEKNIHLIDVDKDSFPMSSQFDLVISLISWGFHYPVDVYVDQVTRTLSPQGVLIMDVRKNQNEENILTQYFKNAEVIYTEGKFNRFKLTGPLIRS